jgi:UDP-N-acetylglucosamine 3-dehydrogenase
MTMSFEGATGKFGAKRALRIGVIGAGIMGTNHARVLAGLPDTTLVGIVDPLPEHRARATELAGCRAFSTVDELIAEGVDAVTIAAPTHLHHEVALVCIAHGIHLLVEKPIASTVEEGREIVDAASRAGVTLMVGHANASTRRSPRSSRRWRARIFFRSRSRGSVRFRRACPMSGW